MIFDKFNTYKDDSKFQFLIVNLVCFFILLSIMIYGIFFLDPFLEPVMSDDIAYIKLAKNIFEPVEAPWTYRILTPFLVYLLPVETVMGFIIVNLSSLYATSILLFYYLKKLGFDFGQSIIGVLFFLLNPITLVLLITICVVDLLTFFLFLLAFYALLIRKDSLFLMSVTIGVVNREVILITLIFFFFLKLEELDKKNAIKQTILISIPPIIVFSVIRILYGIDANYFSIDLIINIVSIHYRTLQTNIFIHPYLFYISFGIFWLVSILNLQKIDSIFLKKSIYLIPFVFLQVLIATNYSRLFFIAFPIIIPISLYMFKVHFSRKILFLLMLLAIVLSIIHFLGVLYYVKLTAFSKLMKPESYVFYAIYLILFDIFSVIILFYLFIRSKVIEQKIEE